MIKLFIVSAFAFLLQGCAAHSDKSSTNESLYLDQKFNYQTSSHTYQEIYSLSDEMQSYVDDRLAPLHTLSEKAERLKSDLFSPEVMGITYNPEANFTPSEVFEKGEANCLSLAMLTYSLAKAAKLNGKFREVGLEENWRVTETLTTINDHVNIELTGFELNETNFEIISGYTIDFFPRWRQKAISQKRIPNQQILALFYNNKGADALANKDYDLAYQHFKQASLLAPNVGFIWGNLASVYRKKGFFSAAEQVYFHAFKLSPDSLSLKEGLAILYKHSGKQQLAAKLQLEIEQKRKHNPNYYAMKAEEALNKGEAEQAKALFKQAISLDKGRHNLYLGLAQASLQLNEFDMVEKYLTEGQRAIRYTGQEDIYAAKLSALSRYASNKGH